MKTVLSNPTSPGLSVAKSLVVSTVFPNPLDAPAPQQSAVQPASNLTWKPPGQDSAASKAATLVRGREAGKRMERADYITISKLSNQSREYHLARRGPPKYHSQDEINQLLTGEASGIGSRDERTLPSGAGMLRTAIPGTPRSSTEELDDARGLTEAVGALAGSHVSSNRLGLSQSPSDQSNLTAGSWSADATSELAAAVTAQITADWARRPDSSTAGNQTIKESDPDPTAAAGLAASVDKLIGVGRR